MHMIQHTSFQQKIPYTPVVAIILGGIYIAFQLLLLSGVPYPVIMFRAHL